MKLEDETTKTPSTPRRKEKGIMDERPGDAHLSPVFSFLFVLWPVILCFVSPGECQ